MAMIPGLQTALSGMKVAQGQLDIIGKNIANVDTVGYTRKQAKQSTSVLAGSTVGVTLGNVTRQVNEGLLKSFLASNSSNGYYTAQNQYLSKAEVLLGTPEGDNSIAANVADLQAAFNEFASDVTSSAARYNLLNNAQTITSRLNSITKELQKLRGDADLNITENVANINSLLDELQTLNERITKYSVLGYDGVADLEDSRDQALRELSNMIDISYFKRDNGELVIQTTGGVTLLDREAHHLSHNAIAEASATTSYANGSISGIFVDGEDITEQIRGGEMKGLIEIRDVTLPSLQSQLDELAGVLKSQINEIHNQGTAYPATPSSLTGTRTFMDPTQQQIEIAEGDVRLVIFDQDGKEVATTNLIGGLGFKNGSVSDLASAINDWLQSPTGANMPQGQAYINDDGKLVIDTGDSNYGLSLMDEAASTPGSGQQNAVIRFDANGDGIYDREAAGFSNFFGLNDFFVSENEEYIYDSKVMSKTANLGVKDVVTLGFSFEDNGVLKKGSINIYPSDRLSDIVDKINSDPVLGENLNASLVPNGNGYMLRIVNTDGSQLEIYESVAPGDAQTGFLDRIGLQTSNAGTAASIGVRDDLVTSPSLIAGGVPEFNISSGEYQQNPAVNTVANAMGKLFSQSLSFAQSGTIAQTDTTLATYASTFVGNIATQTNNSESSMKYQSELTNSLSLKEAQVSGVDIDEELGQMIIFQQTYAACAQAFTASKEMLDVLLGIV